MKNGNKNDGKLMKDVKKMMKKKRKTIRNYQKWYESMSNDRKFMKNDKRSTILTIGRSDSTHLDSVHSEDWDGIESLLENHNFL